MNPSKQQSLRQTSEGIGPFADGSGYAITVAGVFSDDREPSIVISQGDSMVFIDRGDWAVVVDAANRALSFIGEYPDNAEAEPTGDVSPLSRAEVFDSRSASGSPLPQTPVAPIADAVGQTDAAGAPAQGNVRSI